MRAQKQSDGKEDKEGEKGAGYEGGGGGGGGGRSHTERETNMTGHSNKHDCERLGGLRNFRRSSCLKQTDGARENTTQTIKNNARKE